MQKTVPKSVDEYLAAQPKEVRAKLEQVRLAIKKAVPEAVEGICYRMPGYKLHGKPMLYFAGFKKHYSLFAASGTFFNALKRAAQRLRSAERDSPLLTYQTRSCESRQADCEASCRWDRNCCAKALRLDQREEQARQLTLTVVPLICG
jgi:hypothetical protein